MEKGVGRHSPKVPGSWAKPPAKSGDQAHSGSVGPLQELLSSLPGGGSRRKQEREQLGQLGPQSGAHLRGREEPPRPRLEWAGPRGRARCRAS